MRASVHAHKFTDCIYIQVRKNRPVTIFPYADFGAYKIKIIHETGSIFDVVETNVVENCIGWLQLLFHAY